MHFYQFLLRMLARNVTLRISAWCVIDNYSFRNEMNYICTETSSVLELEICKPPVTSIARWWEVEFLLKGADSVVAVAVQRAEQMRHQDARHLVESVDEFCSVRRRWCQSTASADGSSTPRRCLSSDGWATDVAAWVLKTIFSKLVQRRDGSARQAWTKLFRIPTPNCRPPDDVTESSSSWGRRRRTSWRPVGY